MEAIVDVWMMARACRVVATSENLTR
jgi:hypothetical protein